MSLFHHPPELQRRLDALRKDLLRDGGPEISTTRNYNFSILPYAPEQEFPVRREIQRLSGDLREAGWNTGLVTLHALFLARLRAEGPDLIDALVRREKQLAGASDPSRGLRALKERVIALLEGPSGLARDVVVEIERLLDEDPQNRTVIFLGRAGALYPFFRTSALLKHVAGHTRNAPVVLLYPGTVVDETGLSFMGVLPPDRDYRPRIYR